MAELRETSSFLVVEAPSPLQPRPHHPVLFAEERDGVLLRALQKRFATFATIRRAWTIVKFGAAFLV